MKRKFCVSLDEDLMKKVDVYCEEKNLSVSAFFQATVNDYLKAQEALPEFKATLSDGLKAIADFIQGKISKDEFGVLLDQNEKDLKTLQKKIES